MSISKKFKNLYEVVDPKSSDYLVGTRNTGIILGGEVVWQDFKYSVSTFLSIISSSFTPEFLNFKIGTDKPDGFIFQDDFLIGDVKFDFRINQIPVAFSIIKDCWNAENGELDFTNKLDSPLEENDEINIIVWGNFNPIFAPSDDNGTVESDDDNNVPV